MMGNVLTALSVTTCVAGAATTARTGWPSRRIDMIIGADPGDDIDLDACVMARRVEDVAGTGMVITGMPGGDGIIAPPAARQAEPDGSTLMFGPAGRPILAGTGDSGQGFRQHAAFPDRDRAAARLNRIGDTSGPYRDALQSS